MFSAHDGGTATAGARFTLVRPDGGRITLPPSDSLGRIFASAIPAGRYLASVAGLRSRSWHDLPRQADCNSCHVDGGNGSAQRAGAPYQFHTELTRTTAACPAITSRLLDYAQLRTPGASAQAAEPSRRVAGFGGVISRHGTSLRCRGLRYPDNAPRYFSEGYYLSSICCWRSRRASASLSPGTDAEACGTHFIDSVDGAAGSFWYRFSYDAGSGTQAELGNRREIRWDELLYQPGAWVQLVTGENLDELKDEYREEIAREKASGHLVPLVQISINPSDFRGNPPGSGRITVQRNFSNVAVGAHGFRATAGTRLPHAVQGSEGRRRLWTSSFTADHGDLSVV
ncbi:MAG: hypothetical protein IPP94_11165 [Ignavibacteria bacterium]|nr:hypothetical protein [Ignavibacteria bacterium]